MTDEGMTFSGCAPLPGPGLVARQGDLVAVAEDAGPGDDPLLAALDAVRAARGDGVAFVLAAARAALEQPRRSAACAGITRGGEVAVYVQGGATAVVRADGGDTVLAGAGSMLPLSQIFAGATVTVRLTLDGSPGDPRVAEGESRTPDRRFRLDGGVVPGGGVVLTAAASPAAPEERDSPTYPVTEVAAASGLTRVAAASDGRDELAEIWFSVPGEKPREDRAEQRGQGQVAALGVLLLDDGTEFPLDRDYIVGREPTLGEDAGRPATPLRITDPAGTVSRTHLRISLTDGQVEVQDLGSANGSLLHLPTGSLELAPHDSAVIVPDTAIGIGNRTLRYLKGPR